MLPPMETVLIVLAIASAAGVLFLLGFDALAAIDARVRADLASRRLKALPAEDQPDWESWARRH